MKYSTMTYTFTRQKDLYDMERMLASDVLEAQSAIPSLRSSICEALTKPDSRVFFR